MRGLEKRWISNLWVPLFLLLSGCITTNATRLGPEKYRPPVNPQSVVLYRTADQVPSRYQEVALYAANRNSSWVKSLGSCNLG
jgi:hypothetical protein